MSEALKTPVETYLPEVAVRDDIHTWLAEVLDGSMRTEFSYTFNGTDLIARDGRALGPVFVDAVHDAAVKMEDDPRYAFELRRRKIELEEYGELIDMAAGNGPNTMVVVSDFPHELYGLSDDFGGYNVLRRQTMLRIVTRQEDGSLKMVSQSLDKSDRLALEDIYGFLGTKAQAGELLGQRIRLDIEPRFQNDLSDTLMRVYDSSLSRTYGGEWYAGRSGGDRRNTMDFAVRQHDLINAYLAGPQTDQTAYNLAAAITARFEGRTSSLLTREATGSLMPTRCLAPIIEMEIQGRIAAQTGKAYSGCGGTLRMESGVEAELASLGYGDQNKKIESGETDKFGSLSFKCQNGHDNKRPRGKLIDCCKTCGVSVKCDD